MKNIDLTQSNQNIKKINVLFNLWRRFYPLAMSDFAMSVSDTIRPIALSRIPNSELSLAAFGIIKSITIFFESPILMIFHASNALSQNKESHRALWLFTLLVSGILTSIFLVICFQPFYDWIFLRAFGVSLDIAKAARFALFLLIPCPALVAIRRFFQGLLVHTGKEDFVSKASLLRLLFTVLSLWMGTIYELDGTIIAAISLIGAVIIELIAILYFSHQSTKKNHLIEKTNVSLPKDLFGITCYYAPLGITSIIIWAARAMLLGIIARSSNGVLAIAIWTAASGFILPIANVTRMIQQIVISSSKYISQQILLHFSIIVGILCCFPLLLLGLTSNGPELLVVLLGDKSTISASLILVMKISVCLPLLTALQNTYQGFLILSDSKWWINISTIINMIFSLTLALILIKLNIAGEVSAALSTIAGLVVEVIILIIRNEVVKDKSFAMANQNSQ